VERTPQVEIAILAGRKLHEVDRVIRRDEARHTSRDCCVEQNGLRIDDYVA
jgi:hypothetical protein